MLSIVILLFSWTQMLYREGMVGAVVGSVRGTMVYKDPPVVNDAAQLVESDLVSLDELVGGLTRG